MPLRSKSRLLAVLCTAVVLHCLVAKVGAQPQYDEWYIDSLITELRDLPNQYDEYDASEDDLAQKRQQLEEEIEAIAAYVKTNDPELAAMLKRTAANSRIAERARQRKAREKDEALERELHLIEREQEEAKDRRNRIIGGLAFALIAFIISRIVKARKRNQY